MRRGDVCLRLARRLTLTLTLTLILTRTLTRTLPLPRHLLETHQAFQLGALECVVATCAFGMGIDKACVLGF